MVHDRYLVALKGKYQQKDDTILDLAIRVLRNDHAIAIVSSRDHLSVQDSVVSQPVSYLGSAVEWSHVASDVHRTFHDIATAGHVHALKKDLVRDILYDVSYLTKDGTQPMDINGDLSSDFVVRKQTKLQNASKLFLKTKELRRHTPIEQKTIQINLSADERQFLVITLPNRYAMWIWAKYLALAYDIWSGVPTWGMTASPKLVISCLAKITSSFEHKSWEGRVVLDFTNEFELLCEQQDGAKIFNLRAMSSLVVALETTPPKAYALEIDVTGVSAAEEGEEGTKTRRTSGILGNVMGAVSGVVKGVGTVAEAASNTAVNVSLGLASTVHTVATADPMHMIRESQGKLADAKQSLLSTIKNAPKSVFGKVETFVVLRCGYQVQSIACHGKSPNCMVFDFSLPDLGVAYIQSKEKEESAKRSAGRLGCRAKKAYIGSEVKDVTDLPEKVPSPLSIDVFWMQGVAGHEKVIASSVPVSQLLLDAKLLNPGVPSSESLLDEWKEVVLPLDRKIELEISNICCSGLCVPSNLIYSSVGLKSAMFAKVQAVDRHGHSKIQAFSSAQTAVVSASAHPEWPTFRYSFSSDERIDKASYIRIEILIENVPPINISIGAVFVPIEYFEAEEKEYTFPVSRFRAPLSVCVFAAEQKRGGSLGSVTLRIRKRTRVLKDSKLKLHMRTRVRESNLYNNSWFAEYFPANDIEHASVFAVSANVVILAEGLKIIDADADSAENNTIVGGVEAKSKGKDNHVFNRAGVPKDKTKDFHDTYPCYVPWEDVSAYSAVSPSILSISLRMNRSSSDGTTPFEMFITNCPAKELCVFIDERVVFAKYRRVICRLAQHGGRPRAIENMSVGTVGDTISAEEISQATKLLADIDSEITSSERIIRDLDACLRKRDDQKMVLERSNLLRKVCRLKLYMAAMVGTGFQVKHKFNQEEVRSLMLSDIEESLKIQESDELATSCARSKFLLEMAEQRIRDIALCGQEYGEGTLKCFVEVLANGYFVEIIDNLAFFYEDMDRSSTKGLSHRLQLIHAYIQCNDRLDMIIESALRPFELKAHPPAKLSRYLDLSELVHWYTSVITAEMCNLVDDVLHIWQDVSKNVTGRAASYNYPLPWIPDRVEKSSGVFFSAIPRDVVDRLMPYLTHGPIRLENLASSYESQMKELGLKVCMAYVNAFLHLAEGYLNALVCKEWRNFQEEEEFHEYLSFLAAVSNDAHRIQAQQVLSLQLMGVLLQVGESTTELADLISRTLQKFDEVKLLALNQFACILFIFMFFGKQEMLQGGFLAAWQQPAEGDEGTFRTIIQDLLSFIDDHEQSLDPSNVIVLKRICADKAVLIVLSVIREAQEASLESHQSFVSSLCKECAWLCRGAFPPLLSELEYEEDAHWIQTSLSILNLYANLLSAELGSKQMQQALTMLSQGLEFASAEEKTAHVHTLCACLSLRGIKQFSPGERGLVKSSSTIASPLQKVVSSLTSPSSTPEKKPLLSMPFLGSSTARNAGAVANSPDHYSLTKEQQENAEDMFVASVRDCIQKILSSPSKPLPTYSRLSFAISPVVSIFGSDPQPLDRLLLFSAAARCSGHDTSVWTRSNAGDMSVPLSTMLDSKPVTYNPALRRLIIKDIQLSDLFYLHFLKTPRSFLCVRVGNHSVMTSVKEGSNANWLDDPHLEIPINAASSTLELEITLHYKGVMADSHVATLRIALHPHTLPPVNNKCHKFSEFSEKAQAAALKATAEGRSLPSLTFNLLST